MVGTTGRGKTTTMNLFTGNLVKNYPFVGKRKTPISSTGSNRGRCTQCDEGKQNLSGVTQKTTKYAKLNPFFGGSGSYRRSLARLDGHCRLGRGGCRGCQRRTGGKIFHCFHGLNFLQVQVAGAEVPVDVAKVWS